MQLIACLGNPEEKYRFTRHNVGMLFGEFLIKKLNLPELKLDNKFKSKLSKGDPLICFPQTYMNNSGLAVAPLVNFYKIDPHEKFLLVYDDLDMEVGRYKLTKISPHTHNGLASVSQQLGTKDFWQLRIGVDNRKGDRTISPPDYVLQNFPEEEVKLLQSEVFPKAFREVEVWLRRD